MSCRAVVCPQWPELEITGTMTTTYLVTDENRQAQPGCSESASKSALDAEQLRKTAILLGIHLP